MILSLLNWAPLVSSALVANEASGNWVVVVAARAAARSAALRAERPIVLPISSRGEGARDDVSALRVFDEAFAHK